MGAKPLDWAGPPDGVGPCDHFGPFYSGGRGEPRDAVKSCNGVELCGGEQPDNLICFLYFRQGVVRVTRKKGQR